MVEVLVEQDICKLCGKILQEKNDFQIKNGFHKECLYREEKKRVEKIKDSQKGIFLSDYKLKIMFNDDEIPLLIKSIRGNLLSVFRAVTHLITENKKIQFDKGSKRNINYGNKITIIIKKVSGDNKTA